jgi:hypothetical protein
MGPITRDRRRHVERLVRGKGVATDPRLSYDAKLLYVAAGLCCDEVGRVTREVIRQAMGDPYTRSIAMNILTKYGCPPLGGGLS